MSDSLDPRDELTERLERLGRQPIDPALQSQHLTALAGVRAGSAFRTSLAGRLKVGAGVLAGFLLGASGLATVGALGPLQPIVADRAAEVANVELPQGPKDKAAKAAAKSAKTNGAKGEGATNKIWAAEDASCPAEGTFRNRGQFLKAAKDGNAAAGMSFADARKSDCGKGMGVDGEAEGADEAPEAPKAPKAEDAPKDDAGKSGDEHGKDSAPGQDKAAAAKDKANGGDENAPAGDENKPAGPAGPAEQADPPVDDAGKSGVTPPVGADSDQTPAEPEAPAADAADQA